MPPTLALFLWFVLLIALLYFDPARSRKLSPALWVPVVWLFILGSRLPSQWLDTQVGVGSIQAMEEGSPIDRGVYVLLIVLSLAVLISRSLNWKAILKANWVLVVFLIYALLSTLWSDYPLIALKRWIRDLGAYLSVLVILTDQRTHEAMCAVLRRLAYLAIPLSILLIKYFPTMGRQYDFWTGTVQYVGATTSKNMLGLLCLVSGLFFFWDTAVRWSERKKKRARRIIVVNALFFALTLWLLNQAHSTTSTICLILGSLIILIFYTGLFRRYPRLLKALAPVTFCLYLILNFGFQMNGSLAQAVGKDPTLTDRTKIWAFLLGMHTNPIIGTGYQSFWLGSRLETFWLQSGLGHINEAHNGFLEVYLELGIIGVAIIAVFLLESYRSLCRRLESRSDLAVFGLAVWLCLVFYNMAEAAFEGGLLYSLFLIGAMRISPKRAYGGVKRVANQTNRASQPDAHPSLGVAARMDQPAENLGEF
jgi:O-antigen ligase